MQSTFLFIAMYLVFVRVRTEQKLVALIEEPCKHAADKKRKLCTTAWGQRRYYRNDQHETTPTLEDIEDIYLRFT